MIVLGCYAGFGLLIYFVNNVVTQPVLGNNVTCSLSSVLESEDTLSSFWCAAYPYLLPLVISGGNLIFPFIFSFVIFYEDYDPKMKLIIDISRSIFLRLLSVGLTLMFIIIDFNC